MTNPPNGMNAYDALLDQTLQAYEEMTSQPPNATDFAYMQAIVRDEVNKEQ